MTDRAQFVEVDKGQFSLLQWLGPELARQGLLKNEEWVPQHVETVRKMFADSRLRIIAGMMVAVSPRSLDYIQQAPVMVSAVARGMDCATVDERKYVVQLWLQAIRESPKLKELMRRHEVAPQLRAIKSRALVHGKDEHNMLRAISRFDPMRIAQSIPNSITAQKNWLLALRAFRSQINFRFQGRDSLIEWAMFALGRTSLRARIPSGVPGAVADFAGQHAETFNFKWTWDQAHAATTRWHDMLAKRSEEQKFFDKYKIGWEDPIDYRGLPLEVEIDGFRFVALDTGAALFAEGREMRHCVASYTQNVLRGDCFIYGVRVGERRYATLELRLSPDFRGVRAVQLKGPCNSSVSPAIRDAVDSFMRGLNQRSPQDIDPKAVIDLKQQAIGRYLDAATLRLLGAD